MGHLVYTYIYIYIYIYTRVQNKKILIITLHNLYYIHTYILHGVTKIWQILGANFSHQNRKKIYMTYIHNHTATEIQWDAEFKQIFINEKWNIFIIIKYLFLIFNNNKCSKCLSFYSRHMDTDYGLSHSFGDAETVANSFTSSKDALVWDIYVLSIWIS